MRSRQTEPVLDGWARVTEEAIVNECAGTALSVPSSSSETGAGSPSASNRTKSL